MPTISNSPDIGVLEVEVEIDISGSSPVINLTNQTTANPNTSPTPTLNDLEWVLNIYSPTGTPILQSNFTSPWKTGVWTTQAITNQWPRPFGQIEWSGGDYLIQFDVKDSVGNVYQLYKVATICRPTGNTNKMPDTYGRVDLTVEVKCDTAQLYIRDATSKSYGGHNGALESSYLAVDYPRDPTGVLPTPFTITSFVTDALVPFNYNGRGYDASYYSIYRYDLGDNVFVIIRYVAQLSFDVACNIDLCPLACEVEQLEYAIANGTCDNIQEAKQKLALITPKLLRAFIAKANPACGIDLAALVEEIKAVGGFGCDCYGASSGIGTSGIANNFNFQINNQGGDVVGSWSVTGNNVTLNIKDKSYTFGPSANASILLVPTTSGTNTDVQLQVSIDDLATDIYNATAASGTLLNLFNSLVIGGGFKLNVNGKCVINNGACNLEWQLSGIATAPLNSFLVYANVNGVNKSLNYAFNTSTLTALQTYLNTLGLGTFTVTNLGGGDVQIVSNSNASGLTDFTYATGIGGAKKLAALTKDCSGYISYTPDEIVQAIIDYLCGLTDAQMVTSQAYEICYVDPATKLASTITISSGALLADFIAELLARGCDTITYIMSLAGSIDCQKVNSLYPASIKVLQENDFILGTKEADCARIYPVELGTKMLQYGFNNVEFKAAFCALVAACAGGGSCAPYSVLSCSTVENSPFDNQMDIIVTFTHPDAVSNLIRYARLDTPGPLVWSVPATVLPGASPYTIANVDEGQYIIGITPVYSDGRVCSEQQTTTSSCSLMSAFAAAFNNGTGNIDITYSAPVSVPKVRVVINYPNGGQYSNIYNNGASISITPPAGLYGNYSITMQCVCNEATGWYGQATAPSVITIAVPSSLQNDTAEQMRNNTGWYYVTLSATPVPIIASSLIASGNSYAFNLPDGFYERIYINTKLDADVATLATLTTGTGVYNAVVTSGTPAAGLYPRLLNFYNVQILNGCIISVIDTSP